MAAGRDDSQTAIEAVDPLVGTIFDKRFRIEERIAAGGFGAIYRARHVKSGHPIALKVLHPTLASDLGVLARFRREGTTLTSLRNPHTITAYEFGQVDKTLFIVMELLNGESLYEHYEVDGPLAWPRMAKIAAQVCESLEEAHAQGIVHRDLKPTNIHLEEVDGETDFVKVLDFGIAKILQGSEQDASDITNAGQMIGTLDYMSPEQMVGGQVTGQTDIYTLGIVIYEMIAGTRPFPESATAGAALAAMLKTTPEPLYLRAPVPRTLDAIVMKCLERETQKRYRTVGDLRRDLLGAISDMSMATATVQVPKDVFSDPDATTVTPPPEKILDALRRTMGNDDTVALDDAVTPRPGRSGSLRTRDIADATVRSQAAASEWDEDDEGAATTTRGPDGTDMSAPKAPRSPSPVRPTPRPLESRHVSTPLPQVVVAPFSSTPRVPPANVPPSNPGIAVAPQSSTPMHPQGGHGSPPTQMQHPQSPMHPQSTMPHGAHGGPPSPTHSQGGHGSAQTPMQHPQSMHPQSPMHPQSAMHPQSPMHPQSSMHPQSPMPHGAHGGPQSPTHSQGAHGMTPMHGHTPLGIPAQHGHTPLGVPAQHGHTPLGVPAQHGHTPLGIPAQHGHTPLGIPAQHGHTPLGIPVQPPLPGHPHANSATGGAGHPPHAIPATGGVGRPPSAKFDMGQMAAREATVRRLIWIVVLVVAAIVGFVLAMQL